MPCRASFSAFAIGMFWATLLVSPESALAWNASGHRLSVAVAWPALSEPVRRKVEAILVSHPESPRWAGLKRAAWPGGVLAEASVWPDELRRAERQRTERDGGQVDEGRAHRDWHYLDWPIGEPRSTSRGGQIDVQIERLSRLVADPASPLQERAEALAWLAHLVGDAHQPLHVATWRDEDGNWTAGGNGVELIDPGHPIQPATNLHRFWDELGGSPGLRGERLLERAAGLRRLLAEGLTDPGSARQWIEESHAIAATIHPPTGQPRPWTVDSAYRARAQEIADRRIALAGARLAALLESLLGP